MYFHISTSAFYLLRRKMLKFKGCKHFGKVICVWYATGIKFGGYNLALNYSPKQSKNQRSINKWLLSPKKGICHNCSMKHIYT